VHVPEYNTITPSVIEPDPIFGSGVICIVPDEGTVIANQISFEVELNPPCWGALPPTQPEGVGAVILAVAPIVVNSKY